MSPKPLTLARLAQALELPFQGDGERLLSRALPLEAPAPDALSFSEKPGALQAAPEQIGALIAPVAPPGEGWHLIVSERPRVTFARALALLYPDPPARRGVHETAWVHPEAQIDASAWIGPGCSLAAGVRVGPGCQLQAQVCLGAGTSLAENNQLLPGVSLGANCRLGPGNFIEPLVRLGSGTRLGADNYVGARCVLDGCRLGDGCRIDNLVFVGRDADIGNHVILVSQGLIESEAQIGTYGLIAAQAVVDAGVHVAPQVQVAGRCWVREHVTQSGIALAGEPAVDYRQEMRNRALRGRCLTLYRQRRDPGKGGAEEKGG